MNKETKHDIINILFLIISFFIVYFAITRFTYFFGSTKDWNQQHSIVPEYFRMLFYKNHNLFPNFAFNLGSGQNIYNFAYYGFLSPIILISYLLPFVPMREFISLSTIICILASTIMMYFFVKKKTDSKCALISSFIFLMATPIIFHGHRHIMFINYFPFLLLGYLGVEKYFEKKSYVLLTMSVFLMIMTSYFYSVGGLLSIVIYGIYCYIDTQDRITIKSFILDGIKFLIPILIGVLLSCILIVPTFYSLLVGRETSNEAINIIDLFLPYFSIKAVLYSSYSLGLSSIAIFSLIYSILSKKKENVFLGIILFLIVTFPIFTFCLNGGLYVEYKALIPLLPLFIILIGNTLKDVSTKKVKVTIISMLTIFLCSLSLYFIRMPLVGNLIIELPIVLICLYFLNKKKSFKFFYILLLPVLLISSIAFNCGDKLVRRDFNDRFEEPIVDLLKEDLSSYRINVYDRNLNDSNRVYDEDYYGTAIYSSNQSQPYEDFYYKRIGNNVLCRSYRQMKNTNNLFYNMYLGNKYIVTDNLDSYFYKKEKDKVYKNENVLPIGYVKNRVMSLKEYETLLYPEQLYAYLNYVIIDDDSIESNYENVFKKIDLEYEVLENNISYEKQRNNNIINSNKNNNLIKLKINNNLENKILLIRFKMNYQESCEVGDTYITINGQTNKLSCRGWKYNNNNYDFEYVLDSVNLDELDIYFSKGKFVLSDFEFFTLEYEKINDITKNISSFALDREKTKGDKIYGSINVIEKGYFDLSVPYDDGFTIYVDEQKVNYINVDVDFLGFEIDKGHHEVLITYESPYRKVGIILSLIGLLFLIIEVFMGTIKKVIAEIRDPQTKFFKLVMRIYNKYKEIFNYLVVGVLTTIVSLGSKWLLLFTVLNAENAFELQVAIILSWICAVLFAYIANRLFVFYSKNKHILKEMLQFFGARILTLLMEMIILWFFVTLLKLNTDSWVLIWTIVTQVLIMIFNYIFSKLFIFKKK